MAKKKAAKRKAPRAAPKKAAKRAVKAARPKGRKASKFKAVPVSKKFKDRFQKFYYYHRGDLNKFRRSTYQQKKKKGICVKCKKKSLASSIFCAFHLNRSRVYNGRR
jgi:hypothetical protein